MSYKTNKQKKIFATSLTTAMVASAVVPAAVSAADFPDVPNDHIYAEAIQSLAANEVINGYEDGEFKMGNHITRAEAAQMMSNILGLDENAEAAPFSDVKQDAWYAEAINALYATGDVSGIGGGEFGPNHDITRAQIAQLIVDAYDIPRTTADTPFTDVKEDVWYTSAIETLYAHDLIDGTTETTFSPDEEMKRGDFAWLLYNVEQAMTEDDMTGISGFIMNDGVPLVDATVTIDGQTATTNEHGFYEISNVAPGTYDVTVEADGFETVTLDDKTVVDDQFTAVSTDLGENVIDTTEISLSGVVVDAETGEDADGAMVMLEVYDEEQEMWVELGTQTVADGQYTFTQEDVEPDFKLSGEYRLTVSMDGYKDYTQTVTIDDQEVENTLNGIELEPIEELSVTGEVTDADGEVVANASVTLYDEEGNEVATTTTDAEGNYSFADVQLVSGTYNLVVDDGSSALSYTEFEVTEGSDVTQDIQLEQGYGVSVDVGTESLSGDFNTAATYTLELLNGNTVVDTVEVNGAETLSFDLSRVAPGTYTAQLSGDYLETEEFTIEVDGDTSVEKRAVPAGMVEGTVTDAEQAIMVSLVDADGNVVETVESEDGTYSFSGVEAGTYTVEVSGEGFVTETVEDVSVTKNNTTTVADVQLEVVDTTASISGVVRQAESLTAVEGTVSYYDSEGNLVKRVDVADGSYSVELEEGMYEVVVRGDIIDTHVTTLTVEGGEDLDKVNYTVDEGGDASLDLTVVNSEGEALDVNNVVLADQYADVGDAPADGEWTATDAADTLGVVSYADLSEGTYELMIDLASDEYADVETTATLSTGEEGELKVVAEETADQSEVDFRVVNEVNADVEGATVVVYNEDGSVNEILSTNAEGTADLALLDGEYTLAVYNNGYTVMEHDFTVDGEDVVIPVIQLSVLN